MYFYLWQLLSVIQSKINIILKTIWPRRGSKFKHRNIFIYRYCFKIFFASQELQCYNLEITIQIMLILNCSNRDRRPNTEATREVQRLTQKYMYIGNSSKIFFSRSTMPQFVILLCKHPQIIQTEIVQVVGPKRGSNFNTEIYKENI